MHSIQAALCFIPLLILGAIGSPLLESRGGNGIPQSTYDDLVRYTKYSSAVYQWICPSPLGNTLVKNFNKDSTQAFVVRDDDRKEIVIAYRGTSGIADVLADIQIILTPLRTPGISESSAGSATVHTGFLNAYNAVADDILATVKAQVQAYPGYSIVSTGHSLGGAEASIAALAYKTAFPDVPQKLYTFGQPRTGNAAFASSVENTLGAENIFRGIHTFDGIPTILLQALGYQHFGTEYWNFQEPPQASNVKQCSGSEDASCSDSICLNIAHTYYFGQVMTLNPLLCF